MMGFSSIRHSPAYDPLPDPVDTEESGWVVDLLMTR